MSSSVSSTVGVGLRVVGHRAQEDRDRQLALAVDADEDLALLVDLDLEPRAAGRHQVRDEDLLLAVLGLHEVGARRADQLRHDDALGAVDDERAALGHPREVAHEDRLLADLARLVVDEGDRDGQRPRVGEVLLAALLDRERRVVEDELAEVDGEVAGVVLDRRDVVDRLPQAPLLGIRQPLERAALDVDEVGDLVGPCSGARTYGACGERQHEAQQRLLKGSRGQGGRGRAWRESARRDCQCSTARGGPPAGRSALTDPARGLRVCGAGPDCRAASTIGRRRQCSGRKSAS